ncbi:MAG TPA: MBL fold metallo-hydrolase [Ignavibacteria bacterium]|nr:MBL fold metallo-hydrolase [Ignavibacteria bacterium]HRF64902.1 MBL fold metallo-hydrolase [Ignavibacteria bacterium]
MRKFGKILLTVTFLQLFLTQGCNLLMVAVKNVPTFFERPREVKNKIKDPIKPDVRLSALWIGHATVLLQMDDKVIITDPFLTETAGEFARRVVEPGMNVEDIPACDVILISHSHFDHLNLASLEMLEEKSSKTALVFPKDLENYLPDYDMKLIRMKNDNGYESKLTGETKIVNGVKITTVFAQHWGGRYGLDGYIWGDKAFTGYIIEYNGMTVYFAGDTGYDPVKFKKLGEMFRIDLALIPIGPCADCKQCGTFSHVFPPDAYMIFQDVKASRMLPIHYGTLHFAQADPMEPLYAFRDIIRSNKAEEMIRILEIGEQEIYIRK